MSKPKIIWSNQAKESLLKIYNFFFYEKKTPLGAKNVLNDLLDAPKSINFRNQYQVDDINPNFRRIVVRNYKILYKVEREKIIIIDIFSVYQSPQILKKIKEE